MRVLQHRRRQPIRPPSMTRHIRSAPPMRFTRAPTTGQREATVALDCGGDMADWALVRACFCVCICA